MADIAQELTSCGVHKFTSDRVRDEGDFASVGSSLYKASMVYQFAFPGRCCAFCGLVAVCRRVLGSVVHSG